MTNSPDPSVHRQRERQFVEHMLRLLDDERLRLDTSRGRVGVRTLHREVQRGDASVELKRLMSQMNLPDRELQHRMPVGERIDVTLSKRSWVGLRRAVGRLRAVCVSPVESLLAGQGPPPVDAAGVLKLISPSDGLTTTWAIMSTSGFSRDAHELAERRAQRAVVLIEPNDAGGWTVHGPPEAKDLTDLFDPEAEQHKRQRVRRAIDENAAELLSGGNGLAGDRLAVKTHLPLQLVESEIKSYANEHAGLTARRLDGRVVLYRERLAPADARGGSNMPLVDRIRALFTRKGDNEKKIAFLAERRAALGQQRDRSYEEMAALEKKEADLHEQFKASSNVVVRRRVTSQLLQLRKDLARRQQLLGVLDQQVNIVSTHLHSLELVRQGQIAKLPDSEQLVADATKAEEMLAQLQADTELAESVGTIAHAGMSDEERALYEELEREAGGPTTASIKLDTVAPEEEIEPPPKATAPRRRGEPEAE